MADQEVTQPGNEVAKPPMDVNGLIEIYLSLRDTKKSLEKQFDDQVKPYSERMQKIEVALHKYMQDHGLNSLPTDAGTAYISVKNSASVADGAAFRGHIIETRDWDLADWRANVTAVEDFIKEHGTPPGGVNYRSYETVNIRRPK